MDQLFKLKENHTTFRTEVIAGLTTFMTMAYIIALNPNILTGFGREGQDLWNAVFMATCLASALGTFVMGFFANKPFVMAPGMGLNSFFAVIIADIAAMTGMTYLESFRSCLVIIFIEGTAFLLLSIVGLREKIVEAIPLSIRLGIAPAIGLMLIGIGFGSNAGVYSDTGGPFYVVRDFFGAITASYSSEMLGSGYPEMVLTVMTIFIGLFTIVAFTQRNIKGAVFFGMLIASAFYWICEFIFLGINPFESLKTASFVPPLASMTQLTMLKLNFSGLMELGWFTVITLIITICIIDMFDTIGVLIGTASRAGMLDEEGNMPGIKEALLSDAVGTLAGSLTGTSTVTTYAESASGVEAGGRCGLTAVTAGILFLLSTFAAPLAAIIPPAATSPALIYVGVLMLANLRQIDFTDISQLLPTAMMLICMPISNSIGNGLGEAMICYTCIKLVTGRGREVSWLTFAVSAIFLIKFFVAF